MRRGHVGLSWERSGSTAAAPSGNLSSESNPREKPAHPQAVTRESGHTPASLMAESVPGTSRDF